jgi:hypothetical protein
MGLELEGEHEARHMAIKTLQDLAKDALPSDGDREFVIELRRDAGRPIIRAKLSLVLQTVLDA